MSIFDEIIHAHAVYFQEVGEMPTNLHLGTRQWKRFQAEVLQPAAADGVVWQGGRYFVLGMAVKRDAVNDLLEVGPS